MYGTLKGKTFIILIINSKTIAVNKNGNQFYFFAELARWKQVNNRDYNHRINNTKHLSVEK